MPPPTRFQVLPSSKTKSSGKADLATFFPDRISSIASSSSGVVNSGTALSGLSSASSASSHSSTSSLSSPQTDTDKPVAIEKEVLGPLADENLDQKRSSKQYEIDLLSKHDSDLDASARASVLTLKGKKYRILYDPDLDKKKSRGKHPIYQFNGKGSRKPAIDPRELVRDYPKGLSSPIKRKQCLQSLLIYKYIYDENSVEPKPPSQILISGISKLITENAVALHFKRFGDFEEFNIQRDPTTNASLGLCLIRFKNTSSKDLLSGNYAARKAVKEAADGKMRIGLDSVVVEFDDDATKCSGMIEKMRSDILVLPPSNNIRSSMDKSSVKSSVISQIRSPSPSRNTQLQRPISGISSTDGQESHETPRISTRGRSYDRDSRSRSGSRSPYYDAHHRSSRLYSSRLSHPPNSKASSDYQEHGSSGLLSKIASSPYIFISDKYVPVSRVYISDIKHYLRDYDWVKIYSEERVGFYVVFDSRTEAQACFRHMDGRLLFHYRVNMDLHLQRSIQVASERRDNVAGQESLRTHSFVDRNGNDLSQSVAVLLKPKKSTDPILDTTLLVLKELQETLRKDVKERITIPSIYGYLEPASGSAAAVAPSSISEKKSSDQPADDKNVISYAGELRDLRDIGELPRQTFNEKFESATSDIRQFSGKLPTLPRFKKRYSRVINDSPSQASLKYERPMNHKLNSASEEQSYGSLDHDLDDNTLANITNNHKDSYDDNESDDSMDFIDKFRESEVRRNSLLLKNKAFKQRSPDDLSGDELSDNDSHFAKSNLSHKKGQKRKKGQKTGKIIKKKKIVHLDFTTSEEEEEEEDRDQEIVEAIAMENVVEDVKDKPGNLQFSQEEFSYWLPTEKLVLDVDDDDELLDLDGIQNRLIDDEDFALLSSVLQSHTTDDLGNAEYWSWRHKETKSNKIGAPVKGIISPTSE